MDDGPIGIAQLRLEGPLGPFPMRQSPSHPRSAHLRNLQRATSAPGFGTNLDQAFLFQRAQVPGQRRAIHADQSREGGNRHGAIDSNGDQDSELSGTKPGRAQRIVIGSGYGAGCHSHLVTGTILNDIPLGRHAGPLVWQLSCIYTTHSARIVNSKPEPAFGVACGRYRADEHACSQSVSERVLRRRSGGRAGRTAPAARPGLAPAGSPGTRAAWGRRRRRRARRGWGDRSAWSGSPGGRPG